MNMVLDIIFRDLHLLWKQILGSALIVIGFGLMIYGSRRPPSSKHLQTIGSSTEEQYYQSYAGQKKDIQALDESKTEFIN